MAEFTKLPLGGLDCEGEGERGERGKRGHRGHRGPRGPEGPQGPTGPGGPATTLVGPTEGPGTLVAGEDIPAGSVIASGSALRALAAAVKSTLGPRGRNVIGVASQNTTAGQPTPYVAEGPLELATGTWDAVTGGSGGLTPNAVYFLSQTTPGQMTTVRPNAGQIVRVGAALSPTILDIYLVYPVDGFDAFIFDPSNNFGVIQNSGGNRATGGFALAEGNGTTASGFSAHAEGQASLASGGGAHAEGRGGNVASGDGSHAEGGLPFSGTGTLASGGASHAEGSGTTASGLASHAEGQQCAAAGDQAHAEGFSTVASGAAAHAEGRQTAASGTESHAEGNLTVASSANAHAEGSNTIASGAGSHAEGAGSIASGNISHAEGANTTSSGGGGSHSEGEGTIASAPQAHAEGFFTIASGGHSHAEGEGTVASGLDSHAGGSGTIASGQSSHSQGSFSSASRTTQDAFASGRFTTTGDAQTSKLVVRGSTPGIAVNESVELKYGDVPDETFQLEDTKNYAVKVVASCGGVQGLNTVTRVLELSFNVWRGGGLSVIEGTQVTASYGNTNGATWTLTASIGAGPDRVVLTFSTGAGPASIVNVAAKVEFTEVVLPTVIP